MPRRWLPLLLCCTAALALPFPAPHEVDSDESRRVLGSSVVTSVSVIMDLGNGTKAYFADAAGRPVSKPSVAAMVGSPPGLLAPDRYEFYTFDEAGDLVKRFMTLSQIQSIIAGGEGQQDAPEFYSDRVSGETLEGSGTMGVRDVVASVQNVLKSELEANKHKPPVPIMTPPVSSSDSASSWSVILPAIFGGSTGSTTEQSSTTAATPLSTNSTTTISTTQAPTTQQVSEHSAASTESSSEDLPLASDEIIPLITLPEKQSSIPEHSSSRPLVDTPVQKVSSTPAVNPSSTPSPYTGAPLLTSNETEGTLPPFTETPSLLASNNPEETLPPYTGTPSLLPSNKPEATLPPNSNKPEATLPPNSNKPEETLQPFTGTPSLLPNNKPEGTQPPYSGTSSLSPSNKPEETSPPYSGTSSLSPSDKPEEIPPAYSEFSSLSPINKPGVTPPPYSGTSSLSPSNKPEGTPPPYSEISSLSPNNKPGGTPTPYSGTSSLSPNDKPEEIPPPYSEISSLSPSNKPGGTPPPYSETSSLSPSNKPDETPPPYTGTPSLLPNNKPEGTPPPYSETASLLTSNRPEETLPPYSGTPSLLPSSTPAATLPPYSGTPSLLSSNRPEETLPPYSGTPSLLPSNTPEVPFPPYSGTPSLLPSTTTESIILPNEEITLLTTEKSTTTVFPESEEVLSVQESEEQQDISESENPPHGVYPSLADTLESIIKDAIAQDFGSSTVESITETSLLTSSGGFVDSKPNVELSQSLADEDQIPQMSGISSESATIGEAKLPEVEPETIASQESSLPDSPESVLPESQETPSTFQQSSDVSVEQTTIFQKPLSGISPQQPPIVSFPQHQVVTLALDLAPPFLDSELQRPASEEQFSEQTQSTYQDNPAIETSVTTSFQQSPVGGAQVTPEKPQGVLDDDSNISVTEYSQSSFTPDSQTSVTTTSQQSSIGVVQVSATRPQNISGSDSHISVMESTQNTSTSDSQSPVTIPPEDEDDLQTLKTNTTSDESYTNDIQTSTSNPAQITASFANSPTLITNISQDTSSNDDYIISTLSSQGTTSTDDSQTLITSIAQNTPSVDDSQTLTTIPSQDITYSDEYESLKTTNISPDILSTDESQILTTIPSQSIPYFDTLTTKQSDNPPVVDSQTLTTNPPKFQSTAAITEKSSQTNYPDESSALYDAALLGESSTESSQEETAGSSDSSDESSDVGYTTANPQITDKYTVEFTTESVSNDPEVSNTERNEPLQTSFGNVESEKVGQGSNAPNSTARPDSPSGILDAGSTVGITATEETTAPAISAAVASHIEGATVFTGAVTGAESSSASTPLEIQDLEDPLTISQELAESLTSVLSQVADQDTATTILDDINASGLSQGSDRTGQVPTTTSATDYSEENAPSDQKIELDTIAEVLDAQPVVSHQISQTSSTESTSSENSEEHEDLVTTLSDEVAVTTESYDENVSVSAINTGSEEVGLNKEPEKDKNVEAIEKDIEKEDVSNETDEDGVVKRQEEKINADKVDEGDKSPNKVESDGVASNANNEDLAVKPQVDNVPVPLKTSPIVYEDAATYNAFGAAIEKERNPEKTVVSVSSSQSVVSSKLDTSAEQKDVLGPYSGNDKEGMDVVNDSNGLKEATFGLKLVDEEDVEQKDKSDVNEDGTENYAPTTDYPEVPEVTEYVTLRVDVQGIVNPGSTAAVAKPSVMLLPPADDASDEYTSEPADEDFGSATNTSSDEDYATDEPESHTSPAESDASPEQSTVANNDFASEESSTEATVPGEDTPAAEPATDDAKDESLESSETLYDPTEVNTESLETEKPNYEEDGHINTEAPGIEDVEDQTLVNDSQGVTESAEGSTSAKVVVKDAVNASEGSQDKGDSEDISTTLPPDTASTEESVSTERTSEDVSVVIKGAMNTESQDAPVVVKESPLHQTNTASEEAVSTIAAEDDDVDVKPTGLKDSAHDLRPLTPLRPGLDAQSFLPPVELHPTPQENLGLEASTVGLSSDVRKFADLCNELAFRMWTAVSVRGLNTARSVVMSPIGLTSILAMVFLGARGPTSGQMNDILRLDDMVTFNPHQVFRNVTESVVLGRNPGVATAAFVRELYSDKTKGKLLDFYKERAQQFYDGHVEEVGFNTISDVLRRRTNLLVKRQTRGKVAEYLRGSSIMLHPPLAAFSANIFQTDCSQASTEGRDGEMYFTVLPSSRQRRLVPVPAAVWRSEFLAGYEPSLDATAVALGGTDGSLVSVLLLLPGQQGQLAPGDGLGPLEHRLLEPSFRRGAWSRVLRCLSARPGLELQLPRFSHRSLLNLTSALQRMGLKDLFSAERADLRGLNGVPNDLHLSDVVQVNTFGTCGEDGVGTRHHVEVYPTAPQPQRTGRRDFPDLSHVPLALRPRQARLPESPRLRFDRPFLYFVRHNPTGFILHMGRFNPHLLH